MARRVYDDETKRQAIALAVEFGVVESSSLTGVPVGTLRSWLSRSGIATECNERTRAAVEAHKVNAEERRGRLAQRLLELAEIATELEVGLVKNAGLRDVVGARTRAIHDHQLLTGQATARTEHTAEPVHAVVDEIAARRNRSAA